MQTIISFPRELSEMVLHRGNEIFEVDLDLHVETFLQVAVPMLRFAIAEELRLREDPALGQDMVEIDIVENIGAFATYGMRKPWVSTGEVAATKLILREKLISDEEM